MKLVFNFLIVSTCIFASARRQQDYDYEPITNINDDYSAEDDPVSSRYISQKGNVRKFFALEAAIDYTDKNMICSPMSTLLPLGKLGIGAKDGALQELMLAIGVSSKRKLKAHFKHLIEDLKYVHGVHLDMASRIYLSKFLNLQRKFVDRSKIIFDSAVEQIDFESPADAAYIINTWVAKKTNGMIMELIDPRELNPVTSLVLVNAVYFAGTWKEPFNLFDGGSFFTPTGEKAAQMMTSESWYNYARSDVLGAQLIEVPYDGDEASFVILLPYEQNGLPALLTQLKLAPELLNAELSKMTKVKVILTMPKFKIETQLNLVELYKKIGLENIFDPKNSKLTKIVRDHSMYVSTAIQKAVIEVTEIGTEAAAANMAQMLALTLIVNRERVICDHPFMFLVMANGEQLFVGTLNNP